MITFQQKLDNRIKEKKTMLCVGLDTNVAMIPEHLKSEDHEQFKFNREIIDSTHDLVCAYKPNSAFYEACGDDGVTQLKLTIEYIQNKYPEIPIILDAKRADIGSTNEGYVSYAFDYLGVDAITLHPFLGKEALEPFFLRKEKGLIILCRTSNPGASEFQDLEVHGEPLYRYIAKRVSKEWNGNGNCLLVIGATYPKELQEVREIVGDMTFLIPGIGAQGGEIEKTVLAGVNSKNRGMIINSSRGIIFASDGEDFAEKAREEALKLRDAINNTLSRKQPVHTNV